MFGFGCVDGRCLVSRFEDNYQGIKPSVDQKDRMMSKSMKR